MMNNNEERKLKAFAKAFDQVLEKILPEKKKRTPVQIDLAIEKSTHDKKKGDSYYWEGPTWL